MLPLAIALFFFGSDRAFCEEIAAPVPEERSALFVGGGLISQDLGRNSTAPSGKTTFFGQQYFSLVFTLSTRLALLPEWLRFEPSLSITPFPRKSPDGGESAMIAILSGRMAWKAVEVQRAALELLGGPGLYLYRLSGRGGTTELNNGTRTATFAIPSDSTLTSLFFLDLGTGLVVNLDTIKLRADFDAIFTGPLSSRRAVSLAGSISAGFAL